MSEELPINSSRLANQAIIVPRPRRSDAIGAALQDAFTLARELPSEINACLRRLDRAE